MSDYGKIEWSDPEFEPAHLRFLTFQSPALGGRGDVALFVPEGEGRQDLPMVLAMTSDGLRAEGSAYLHVLDGKAPRSTAADSLRLRSG